MTLDDVIAIADELVLATALAETAEDALKCAKERVRYLSEEALPSAFQSLSLQSLTLKSGRAIELKQDVYASLSEERMPAAVAWLKQEKADGIVKTELTLRFGREERAVCETVVKSLVQQGYEPELKTSIHASTLKAFIRERLAAGLPVDFAILNARGVFCAKLTS